MYVCMYVCSTVYVRMSDERGLCAKLLRSIRYIDARIVSLAVNEVRGAFAVVAVMAVMGKSQIVNSSVGFMIWT